MDSPEDMHPRLHRISVQPSRIRVPRKPIHNRKANSTALRDLKSEIIMYTFRTRQPSALIVSLDPFEGTAVQTLQKWNTQE